MTGATDGPARQVMPGPPVVSRGTTMLGLNVMVLVVGLLVAAGSASRMQRSEPPVLSIATDLVSLPVTVVDEEGALVSGLRQEHFTVYDNGDPRQIEFFTSEDAPLTIGLLIDRSGSMRGRRDDVTAAALAFVDLCHPLDEFFTLNFNEAVWPGLPPHVSFAEDAGQLRAALANAPAQGMTALYDAVSLGLKHLGRGTRDRKALVVVSDGGDNASTQTLEGVVESARVSDAVIYSVTFVDPDNRDGRRQVLKTLTRHTGGHAFFAKGSEDVMRSFARIAREIRSGYTIGFVPNETSDGEFRSIRVVVDAGNHRRLIARTRAGYYAGPSRANHR